MTEQAKTYATALEEMLSSGVEKIDVCVWNKHQKVPARSYIETNSADYPDADIKLKVMKKPGTTGQIVKGRMRIVYNFG